MPLGRTVTVTADDQREIYDRLKPHMPRYLKKLEPNPSGWGLRFEFAPFTGREERPSIPRSFYDDPQLKYLPESENAAENLLREKAGQIIGDLYEAARNEWEDAAYVADLRQMVKDAPERWRAYERELKALESAYSYLRTPEAAREWPSAISRLVDAQDRATAAAVRFDERAAEIARVHERHLYADLGHNAALAKAGHPEAKDWRIAGHDDYGRGYYSSFSTCVPLEEQMRRLIEQQDTHIAKVGRLSGAATGSTC